MRVLLDSSVIMSAMTAYNNKNFAISDQNLPNLRSKYDFSDPNENSQSKIGTESLHDSHYGEESDRSLTVMIPRAKYYPSAMQQILLQHQLAMERNSNLECERGTQNEEDILLEIVSWTIFYTVHNAQPFGSEPHVSSQPTFCLCNFSFNIISMFNNQLVLNLNFKHIVTNNNWKILHYIFFRINVLILRIRAVI